MKKIILNKYIFDEIKYISESNLNKGEKFFNREFEKIKKHIIDIMLELGGFYELRNFVNDGKKYIKKIESYNLDNIIVGKYSNIKDTVGEKSILITSTFSSKYNSVNGIAFPKHNLIALFIEKMESQENLFYTLVHEYRHLFQINDMKIGGYEPYHKIETGSEEKYYNQNVEFDANRVRLREVFLSYYFKLVAKPQIENNNWQLNKSDLKDVIIELVKNEKTINNYAGSNRKKMISYLYSSIDSVWPIIKFNHKIYLKIKKAFDNSDLKSLHPLISKFINHPNLADYLRDILIIINNKENFKK